MATKKPTVFDNNFDAYFDDFDNDILKSSTAASKPQPAGKTVAKGGSMASTVANSLISKK